MRNDKISRNYLTEGCSKILFFYFLPVMIKNSAPNTGDLYFYIE